MGGLSGLSGLSGPSAIFGGDSTLINGLVAYYALSDGVDATGRGNTLSNQGGMLFAAGKIGNATSQDGTAKYLYRADNADLSMGNIDFTIAAWVKLANKTAVRPVVSKYDFNGNNREYLLDYINTSDRFRFQVSADGTAGASGQVPANTFGSPSTGVWYLLIAEHQADGNLITISVNNGTANTLAWATGVADKASQFQIGALSPSAQYMNGQVDAVGVWKRLLSDGEKASLYNGGTGVEYPF